MAIIAQKTAEASIIKDAVLYEFYKRLPRRLYCTNSFEHGVTVKKKSLAILYCYLQQNHENMIKTIVFDIDYPVVDKNTLETVWEKAGLATPNIVVQTRESGRGHIMYFLKDGVPTTDAARRKVIEFLADIERAYTILLKADRNYVGLTCKNPLNDFWNVWKLHSNPYTLNELNCFIDKELLKKEKQAKQQIDYSDIFGLGRNCTTFDVARKWAYTEIRKYWSPAGYDRWHRAVLDKCESINAEFTRQMTHNEVKGIARSIAAWTWKHITPDGYQKVLETHGISERQAARARKRGALHRKAIEHRVEEAKELKRMGKTYRAIAAELRVSADTARRWCLTY